VNDCPVASKKSCKQQRKTSTGHACDIKTKIVGLQLDPSIDRPEKNAPSHSIIERYIQLKGSKHVDEIVPYVSEQDLEDILKSFKIDVRIIGDEYKEKNFTGRVYCEEKGIELYYNSRDHRFSSSGLRKQVKIAEDK